MAVWSDDEEVACVHPGGPRVVGSVAVRAAFEAVFVNGPVHVQVHHDLAAIWSGVHNEAVAAFLDTLLAGNLGSHVDHPAYEGSRLSVDVRRIDNVLAGHDQDVGWSNRRNIVKGNHIVVFVDKFGGRFATRDFAKDAIGGHAGSSFRRGHGLAAARGLDHSSAAASP